MLQTRTAFVGLAICTLSLAALTGCSTAASSGSSSSSSSSAAASSSGSSSNVARPANVCSLISTDEAASVFTGDTFSAPYESDGACNYSSEDDNFDVMLSPSNVDWATATSIAKVQYGTLTPVSGVGDQAVKAKSFLQFRKGSLVFTISYPDTDTDASDKYIALAKILLSHLG